MDKTYYPGYTSAKRLLEIKSRNIKTQQDQVNLDKDILTARLSMPTGKKFTLGGITYTGLKQSGSDLTVDEKKQLLGQKINTLFSPGYTIPNSGGIPYIDNNGFVTPDGWKIVIKTSGLPRKDFIEQYGYLIPTDSIDSYNLTRPEKDLILGKL